MAEIKIFENEPEEERHQACSYHHRPFTIMAGVSFEVDEQSRAITWEKMKWCKGNDPPHFFSASFPLTLYLVTSDELEV